MQPIVRSLLDTDLYKFTMWQTLLHTHPAAQAEYEFVCRNEPAFPLAELKEEVERELDHLCTCASPTPRSPTCARCASSRATSPIS
jgi:nicotinate phosphoribosyltransferase